MTSTRPSCIGPSTARCARVIAISRSTHTGSRSSKPDRRQVDRGGVVGRHPAAPARPAWSSCPPPRPTCGPARRAPPATPRRARSRTTARAAAISSAVGGSECRQRSVSRTQPMSAEKLACDITASRAPPRSSRRRGRRPRKALRRRPIRRPRRGTTAPPPRSPVITSATAPGTTAPSTSAVIAKNSSRLAASRVADVATIRTFGHLVIAHQLRVVAERRPGAGERVGRELARSRRHPGPAARSASRGARRARRPSVDVGDRAAGSSWCRSRSAADPAMSSTSSADPRMPAIAGSVGQHRQRLVAERIHAAALWPASARSPRADT